MALRSTKDLELRITAKNETKGAFSNIANDIKKFAQNVSNVGQGGFLGGLKNGLSSVSSMLRSVGSTFGSVFNSISDHIQNASGYIIAFGASLLKMGGVAVKSFIEINSEFERMKVSMDVVTHGQGEAWFNKLNAWAINMPVSMAEVSKAFTILNAYSLTPSIKLMENLINVSSVLPDSGRAIMGISRAMGQIQTKTRLEGQELRQLAEWAVPGYEAVYDKIYVNLAKKTGKSIGEMKFTMIDSATAIKALIEVMEEHFGGAARRMAKTWGGMTIVLTNYYKEFVREIGESGVFASLKETVEDFVKFLGDSFKSGEMQKLSKLISNSIGVALQGAFDFKLEAPAKTLGTFADYFINTFSEIVKVVDFLHRSLLGIKLVFQTLENVVATFAVVLHSALYGIMYILDRVIQGIVWVALKIPGLSKKAIDSLNEQSKISSDLVTSARENISTSAQWWSSTVDGIEKTAGAIANSANNADKKIKGLTSELKAYHEEAAKPVKVDMGDKVEGQISFAKQIDAIINQGGKEKKYGSEDKKYWHDLQLSILGTMGPLDMVQEGFYQWANEINEGSLERIIKGVKQLADDVKNGFSNAFVGIMEGNMNLMQSFTAMAKVIRQSIFKLIADVAAEWIMMRMKDLYNHLFVEKAKTAATIEGNVERGAVEEATTLKSIALKLWEGLRFIAIEAYKAAAAMWGFFASLGPFGWLAGGAAAGAAIATIMALGKKMSSFETGTGLMGVRDTGPALLHKGEIVLNKKESDVFRDMAHSGGQTSNVNLSFNISAMDGEDVERIVKKKIIPLLREDVRNFGKMRTTIKGTV